MNIDTLYSQGQALSDAISDWETERGVALPVYECDSCGAVWQHLASWCPKCSEPDATWITEDVLERRIIAAVREGLED